MYVFCCLAVESTYVRPSCAQFNVRMCVHPKSFSAPNLYPCPLLHVDHPSVDGRDQVIDIVGRDQDDDKYKKKSSSHWLARWLR